MYKFTKEDRDQLLESFELFDQNNDGVIDKQELKHILDAVNETEKPYDMEMVEKII